jgi:membrane protease YdiL (CAAX protease family)
LLHLGQGWAPVPLFFLSLALGWLYQRTHRLLPSLVVHVCLNSCSLLMLRMASG